MRLLKHLFIFLFLSNVLIVANHANGQDIYLETAYMKVAPGGSGDYTELEKFWKPIHQERVNAGNILGWFLYEVESPRGSEVHHNYVIVTVYPSFEATRNSYPEGVWEKVHPGMNWEEVSARTLAARDNVRGETWREVVRLPGKQPESPAKFLQVAYMKVPVGGVQQYLELEKLWMKIHETRIADGTLKNWGVYGLRFPGGSGTKYDFAAVSGYESFGDLNKFDFPGAVSKANLGMEPDKVGEMTMAARDNVHAELWRLVDYVNIPE